MARESKGQQVKTFKGFEPQADMSSLEKVFKVYFQASEGMFYIYLANHIARTVDALDIHERTLRSENGVWVSPYYASQNPKYQPDREGHVRAKIMNRAIETYRTVLEQYAALMRTQQRKKVIVFEHKANLHTIPGSMRGFNELSFCGTPALHLTYQVLYEANGVLYRVWDEGGERERMEYHARVSGKDGRVIPWTQEREDFLRRLQTNLENLILRVRQFSEDLEGNMDRMIAAGGSFQALPAPAPAIEPPAPRPRTRPARGTPPCPQNS